MGAEMVCVQRVLPFFWGVELIIEVRFFRVAGRAGLVWGAKALFQGENGVFWPQKRVWGALEARLHALVTHLHALEANVEALEANLHTFRGTLGSLEVRLRAVRGTLESGSARLHGSQNAPGKPPGRLWGGAVAGWDVELHGERRGKSGGKGGAEHECPGCSRGSRAAGYSGWKKIFLRGEFFFGKGDAPGCLGLRRPAAALRCGSPAAGGGFSFLLRRSSREEVAAGAALMRGSRHLFSGERESRGKESAPPAAGLPEPKAAAGLPQSRDFVRGLRPTLRPPWRFHRSRSPPRCAPRRVWLLL